MAKNNGAHRRGLRHDPGPAAPVKRRNRRVIVDGRTRSAKRWKALVAAYTAQAPRQETQTLCRQAASLQLQREQLDAALARGEDVNVDELVRVSGALSRTLERLGLAKPQARSKWDQISAALKRAKQEASV